ncbi:uncharacterized protein K489DRAFT_380603 [Dissoconium aciculare CBS 342.82]|uniref:SET domain-containing protein n=1 Tax=Dissoconium aciculare CBS 342.82 TaxID=1314786 RepID=A0A6J3M6Q6_9PEZI|nr:uncharacterized protein K489DRAFT_380603 [Dissoconium aciculare CBS 342.82]KAF1823199.1 hypothetical protein K489DRAFT_380603 [Dissoconium aciculare CBS 342.82]
MFRNHEVPGKGIGVFATQPIAAGVMILSEKPIVKVPPFSLDPNAKILQQLQARSKDERNAFFALANNYPDTTPVMGIVKTNAMPLGSGAQTGGLFLQCSRFNHSCTSNAAYSWNDDIKEERIFSLFDIADGEEITVTYLTDKMWSLPRDQRREAIWEEYRFRCECVRCTGALDSGRKASDERRVRLGQIHEQVGNGMLMVTKPSTALGLCREAIELIRAEGEGACRLEGIYYDAFQICICHGDVALAKAFIRLFIQTAKAWKGDDALGFVELARLEHDPKLHANAFTTKRWATAITSPPGSLAGEEEWLWRRAARS